MELYTVDLGWNSEVSTSSISELASAKLLSAGPSQSVSSSVNPVTSKDDLPLIQALY